MDIAIINQICFKAEKARKKISTNVKKSANFAWNFIDVIVLYYSVLFTKNDTEYFLIKHAGLQIRWCQKAPFLESLGGRKKPGGNLICQ